MKITLKAARVNAGLNQVEAAQALRISKNTLIAWETGKTSPSYASVKLMSAVYGWPVEDFSLPTNQT